MQVAPAMKLLLKVTLLTLAAIAFPFANYGTAAPWQVVRDESVRQPQPQRPMPQVMRQDFYVTSDSDIRLFVREVLPKERLSDTIPILLVHGGGPGGVASFDLNVPGYSVAADLAVAGHPVYVMDVRGWGSSTRPPELNEPAANNPPAVTSEEAVRDIGAIVDWIRQRRGERTIALVGWATGGHWVGMYASRNNDKVSHLVMLNSLYGVNAPWQLRANFEDPQNPGTFNNEMGAYRLVDVEGFLRGWNNTIPVEDKSLWRVPEVARAYAQTAVERDSTSHQRTPPSARIPIAYREESYNLSLGRKYWDAADITVPTLVMRGELDFWSRAADLEALEAELVNAPSVRTVTIPNGTHYLFNDRPERGRDRFLREVLSFVSHESRASRHLRRHR